MGIPVVSSYHAGIPELIVNEVSGLLSEEKDFQTISNHFSRLINDINLRKSMSIAAREGVLKRFNIKELNDRLLEYYR